MADIAQVQPAAAATGSTGFKKGLFLWLMLLTTIGPVLFIMANWPLNPRAPGTVSQVFAVIAILSTAHVALTAYFYVDPDYRAHIGKNKLYHIALPLAVIAACGAIAASIPTLGAAYIMIFYHAWLLFHYGRQNFGILSFTSAATGGVRPLNSERIALHLVPIGGILGAYVVLPAFGLSAFSPYLPQFVLAGKIVTFAGLAVALFALVRHRMLKQSWWRSALLAVFASFYLPTFLFPENYTSAVLTYAYAHALQYFVFMYFVAAGARSLNPIVAVIALAVVTSLGWGLLMLSREPERWGPLAPALPGIAIALVMWHFLMDADLWRLSQPWQRGEAKARFAFIFSKPNAV